MLFRSYHLGARRLFELMRVTCKKSFPRKLVEHTLKERHQGISDKSLLPKNNIGKIEIPQIDHFTPCTMDHSCIRYHEQQDRNFLLRYLVRYFSNPFFPLVPEYDKNDKNFYSCHQILSNSRSYSYSPDLVN